MDLQEAVDQAREYVVELFAHEQIVNVGLEEAEFDLPEAVWKITLSFTRSWQQQGDLGAKLGLEQARSCKVVLLDNEGQIKSVKDRVLPTTFG